MPMQELTNLQIVILFDENTSTNWSFRLDRVEGSIQVYREKTLLVKHKDCQFPVNSEYLESLTQLSTNVRTMQ